MARPTRKTFAAGGRSAAGSTRIVNERNGAWRILQLHVCVLMFASAGCSRSPSSEDLTARNLSRLGLWYGTFVSHNGGKAPKSVKQLRQYAKGRTSHEQLAALGVTDIDELFVSRRDGEPYKMVVYDQIPAPGGDPIVVFYEQKGQDGNYRVALLGGGSLAVDEERLRKLVPKFGSRK